MTIEKTLRDAKVDQVVGKTKEIAGKISGNQGLENRGRLRAAMGKVEEGAAGRAQQVAGGAREVAGKLQQLAGEVLREDDLVRDGRANEAKGKAKRESGE